MFDVTGASRPTLSGPDWTVGILLAAKAKVEPASNTPASTVKKTIEENATGFL